MRSIASSENSTFTSSVESRATYWNVREFLGSVKIRLKSSLCRESSSTRRGNRPWSSGIKSLGAATLKAPAAMNRIWVVSTTPHFVFTFEPSTIGRMSRCTPSLETSWPPCPPFTAILSISSIKIIPDCSTRFFAISAILSWSTILSSTSSVRILRASFTVTKRLRLLPPVKSDVRFCRPFSKSSMLPPAMISMLGMPDDLRLTSTSTSLSSSLPSRSIWRNFSLVAEDESDESDEAEDSEDAAEEFPDSVEFSWAADLFSRTFSFSNEVKGFSSVFEPKMPPRIDELLPFFFELPGKSKSSSFSSTFGPHFSRMASCISNFTSL